METQLKAMCINKEAFITQPGTGKLLALAAVCATGVFHGLLTENGDTPQKIHLFSLLVMQKGPTGNRQGGGMVRAKHVVTTLPLRAEHLPSPLDKIPAMLLTCTRAGRGERISSHITHWKEQQAAADPISGS